MEVEIRTTVKYKSITLILNDELPIELHESLNKLLVYCDNKYKNPGPNSVKGCLYDKDLGLEEDQRIELFKLLAEI
jgi:hypothetical protein